jgi:Arc/MetJ-type ribon-helix-helix transcriptional regulator
MRKTSVYLSEEQAARVKRLAQAEGRSEADLIRRAIEAYPETRPQRTILCYAVADGPGDSVADIPEEELLKGFGEESVGRA